MRPATVPSTWIPGDTAGVYAAGVTPVSRCTFVTTRRRPPEVQRPHIAWRCPSNLASGERVMSYAHPDEADNVATKVGATSTSGGVEAVNT